MPSLLPHRLSRSYMDPVGRAIARAGLTPNMITTLGYLGNLGAAVVIGRGELRWGGVIMLLASGLDLLDGAVARATNRVTRFGAVYDAVLDRLSEATVLLGLLVYFEQKGDSGLPAVLVFAAVVGSLMVSYVRARAESFGVSLAEGFFTRPERVVLLALGLILGKPIPALWILATVANATALQRLFIVYRKTRTTSGPGSPSTSGSARSAAP